MQDEGYAFRSVIRNEAVLTVDTNRSVMATVPKVPVFKKDENGNERETEVRMYAWKGEQLLGEWDVGSF